MEPYISASYYPRIIEDTIKRKLLVSGCVLITGPMFCGKKTTAASFAKSQFSLTNPNNIALVRINPKLLLTQPKPLLIDEWQNVPEIHDEVRSLIDASGGEVGNYLMTGSSDITDYSKVLHSGEGRFSSVTMYPFSLFESNESDGSISLNNLFKGEDIPFTNENGTTLEDIAFYLCRGGWPSAVAMDKDISTDVIQDLVEQMYAFKSGEGRSVFPSSEIAERVLVSYARNVSSQASLSTIALDVSSSLGRQVDVETVSRYITSYKRLYVIDELIAWCPKLRSQTVVRSGNIRHFSDPSYAAAALGIAPNDLLNDLNTFGLLFEDLALRDIKVYASSFRGKVAHYRDSNNLEVDIVVRKPNGDWGAIEVKLGGEEAINKGINSLTKLRDKIDYTREKEPSFLAVLTAVGLSYRRDDGIYVFPITRLGK